MTLYLAHNGKTYMQIFTRYSVYLTSVKLRTAWEDVNNISFAGF